MLRKKSRSSRKPRIAVLIMDLQMRKERETPRIIWIFKIKPISSVLVSKICDVLFELEIKVNNSNHRYRCPV